MFSIGRLDQSVILTIGRRENGNLEFHRRGRCRPQTGPSWVSHLRLHRPWLCKTCGKYADFLDRCSSGALHALTIARCSRLGGQMKFRGTCSNRNATPHHQAATCPLLNSHSINLQITVCKKISSYLILKRDHLLQYCDVHSSQFAQNGHFTRRRAPVNSMPESSPPSSDNDSTNITPPSSSYVCATQQRPSAKAQLNTKASVKV